MIAKILVNAGLVMVVAQWPLDASPDIRHMPEENYPQKTVTLVEPFGAGGGVDVIARALAAQLSRQWKVAVNVENRPGAGSTEAPAYVARSSPDGYTILVNSSAHAYAAALPSAGYDPIKDFIPVTPLTRQPYVLVANADSRISSLADLIAAARKGNLKFGSPGLCTGSHIAATKINLAAHIRATHIAARPNEGIREVIERTVAGETTYLVAPIPLASSVIRSGKLVPLGVTAARRSPLLLDVPTLSEAGLTGFDFPVWYGVWAPVGTPREIVTKLVQDITKTLSLPELHEWLLSHGSEPMSMTQSQFGEFVIREAAEARKALAESKK